MDACACGKKGKVWWSNRAYCWEHLPQTVHFDQQAPYLRCDAPGCEQPACWRAEFSDGSDKMICNTCMPTHFALSTCVKVSRP